MAYEEAAGAPLTGRDRAYVQRWLDRRSRSAAPRSRCSPTSSSARPWPRTHAPLLLAYLGYAALAFLVWAVSLTIANHANGAEPAGADVAAEPAP